MFWNTFRSRSRSEIKLAGVNTNAATATANVAISSGSKVTFHAEDDTLAEKIVAVKADTTDLAANEVAFFEHGSDTYVYNSVATVDDLVKLTGVTGFTTITESTGNAGDFSLS